MEGPRYKSLRKLLLVASAITALTLVFVSIPPIMRKAHSCHPKQDILEIVWAIRAYHQEYGRFPSSSGWPEDELPRPMIGEVVSVLTNCTPSALNPRGIKFLGLISAGHGTGGLHDSPLGFVAVDFWGHPYYVAVDADGDGKIPNPARGHRVGKDSGVIAPDFLPAIVIAFSAGPDGNPDTLEDNIVSWR